MDGEEITHGENYLEPTRPTDGNGGDTGNGGNGGDTGNRNVVEGFNTEKRDELEGFNGSVSALNTESIRRSYECGIKPPPIGVFKIDETTDINYNWKRYKRSFALLCDYNDVKCTKQKKLLFLMTAGIDVQDIYFNITDTLDDQQEGSEVSSFESMIMVLDKHFEGRSNESLRRVLFRSLKQESSETFENFVNRLKRHARSCNFADPDSDIIDQIIGFSTSDNFRKRALELGKCNLQKLIDLGCTLEAVESQNKSLINSCKQDENTNIDVHKIGVKRRKPNYSDSKELFATKQCARCGRDHANRSCPAFGRKCAKCGYMGHFQSKCRTKMSSQFRNRSNSNSRERSPKRQVLAIERSPKLDRLSEEYVFHLDDISNGGIKTTLLVGKVPISFIIDSGSEVNIIDKDCWDNAKTNKIEVSDCKSKPSVILKGYGSNVPLPLLGEFKAYIAMNDRVKSLAKFYVINGKGKCLLGRKTATELGILQIVLPVNNISSGFSKIKGIIVDLPIDRTITPIAQSYRRIAIPLEGKVENKLKDLVAQDIIEPVDGISRWISPMVIVPKGNDIRLCIDMRQANTAIIRDKYPLPTLDDMLPNIRYSTLFSKIDIRQAFHQLEISPETRDITTFITKNGLYRYKRLMFGISCAPEIFQRVMEKILIGCEGCIVYIDDVLIFGKTQIEHDSRLQKILRRLDGYNVELNKDKMVIGVSKIEFLGHDITPSGIQPTNEKVNTK